MKREDIDFLKGFQRELIESDNDNSKNDCQSNPRYWGIMESICVPSSYDDGELYIYDHNMNDGYTLEEYVSYIDNIVDEQLREGWEKVDKSSYVDVVEFVCSKCISVCDARYMKFIDRLVENALFLTKKEAQRHIELNGYHYSKPRTYGMTAWRSPEFERFIELFKTIDFSKYED